MGNNSIRSNLTKEYIISDLRLSLSEDIFREKVFIVVEGDDDIKFLKSFFKQENTVLYESYDGKNGVSEIVENYFGENKRVIGIRDRDYLQHKECQKIFFYDNCCLEMMIVENKESYSSIYNEFYKGDIDSEELLRMVLGELKFLSIVRKCSEQLNWAINIKALSINKVFNQDEFCIATEKVVKELNRVNNNSIDENRIQIINHFKNEVQSLQELLQITQGHDFSILFSIMCNIYTNKHINAKYVETALRCSYRNDDFKETRLHNALVRYQDSINILFLSA